MENQEETDVDRGATTSRYSSREASTDDNATVAECKKGAHEYISGPKLWLVMASVTLVIFLTILDTTIIVTV
jgi:hypothetical protein